MYKKVCIKILIIPCGITPLQNMNFLKTMYYEFFKGNWHKIWKIIIIIKGIL